MNLVETWYKRLFQLFQDKVELQKAKEKLQQEENAKKRGRIWSAVVTVGGYTFTVLSWILLALLALFGGLLLIGVLLGVVQVLHEVLKLVFLCAIGCGFIFCLFPRAIPI